MKAPSAPGATPLDPDEAAGLRPTSIATRGELDAFEQANILDAEQWASKRKHNDILSDEFIRELHRRMFDQVWSWAGKYRTSDKNIGVPWPQVPVKVRELCDNTRYQVEHATYAWDERGARFHHRLVAIHPFPNGNGRHARLMTDVLLFNHDQPLFTWGARSAGPVAETRERYLAALRAADDLDYTALIAFVRT